MAHRSALPAESDITGERDAGVDEALTSRAPGAGTTDRLAETTDELSSARVLSDAKHPVHGVRPSTLGFTRVFAPYKAAQRPQNLSVVEAAAKGSH